MESKNQKQAMIVDQRLLSGIIRDLKDNKPKSFQELKQRIINHYKPNFKGNISVLV